MTNATTRPLDKNRTILLMLVAGLVAVWLLVPGYAMERAEQMEGLERGDQNAMKQEAAKNVTRPSAEPRQKSSMLVPTIIMGVLAIGLLALGYFRGQGEHLQGLKGSKNMLLQVLPMLVFAFVVASMVQVLLPRGAVSRWIGKESGIRGIIIGCITGGMMPGGPYINLPLAAGLMKAGAGIGTGVAFLTAWSIYAVGRLPMELGIMGLRFTIVRLVSTCLFPPLAGLIARALFERG